MPFWKNVYKWHIDRNHRCLDLFQHGFGNGWKSFYFDCNSICSQEKKVDSMSSTLAYSDSSYSNIYILLLWLPIYRFNLHKNWITTSFVLNLAISDILYSVFYFVGNIDGIWTYKYSCYVVRKLIGNTLLYSEWMSIAMIAVVRCNGIMKSGKPSMFSSRRTRYLVFVLIRLLCVTFLLPLPSKVRFIAQNY